jgi:hypothetical protein
MSYRWTIPHLRGFEPFSLIDGAACGADFEFKRLDFRIRADRLEFVRP